MNGDLLAENRFSLTWSLFYEGMRRVNREGYGKFAKKVVLVLVAVWLVMAAVVVWKEGSPAFVGVQGLVTALVSVWVCVLMPRDRAKRAFKALADKCGADMTRAVFFYPDRAEVQTAEGQTVIPREQFTQLLRAKRLLVLLTTEKKGVLLARDGFTKGDEAAIEGFVKDQDAIEEQGAGGSE